jgi:PAS domain S-box-containing protein
MSKILIVDDEKSIRWTLAEFLRKTGYEVAEAEDVDAAMGLLRGGGFDVVVTDVILPRVTGVELLRMIHNTSPEVLVVMMTGEPTVETAAEAVRLGAVDYLSKPVDKTSILRVVANAARIKSLEDSRRRLEAENRAHRENLERLVAARTEELRKLARAVEQSPAMVLITDRTGIIEFVNPKFCQVSGYSAAEVLGRKPGILKSGEMPLGDYRTLWETIQAGREWRGEFHNRRKDGTLYWESSSISAIRDAAGVITHFISLGEDVTEKKQLEARFLRAQRVESIGSLASGIAHDLNNILAPIMLLMDLLKTQDYGLSQPGELDPIRLIEASTRRAVGIVNQLLVFGRGQEGVKQPIQLRHLLVEMTKIIRETFPRYIEVSSSWPEDLWLVPANSTEMHQVLLNLCVNARDAMPNGGKLVIKAENTVLDSLQLSRANLALEPGAYVRLQVSDTGMGIPVEIRDRIFDSFFTTKAEGAGTGLGLTTVLGIVKEHHGCLSFTSEVGNGTCFEIYLPAVRQHSIEEGKATDNGVVPDGHGELVLVVDDEEVMCKATRAALGYHGYKVLTAKDGIEAIALLAQHPGEIRVMVTDFMMPRMDGIALCTVVRELSPTTKVIVSSGGLFGKEGEQAVQAFKRAGFFHFLHKPHDMDVLLHAIAAELKQTDSTAP